MVIYREHIVFLDLVKVLDLSNTHHIVHPMYLDTWVPLNYICSKNFLRQKDRLYNAPESELVCHTMKKSTHARTYIVHHHDYIYHLDNYSF